MIVYNEKGEMIIILSPKAAEEFDRALKAEIDSWGKPKSK